MKEFERLCNSDPGTVTCKAETVGELNKVSWTGLDPGVRKKTWAVVSNVPVRPRTNDPLPTTFEFTESAVSAGPVALAL